MIDPKDREEAEQTDWDELTRTAREEATPRPVFCERCQKLIDSKGDDGKPKLCISCSGEQGGAALTIAKGSTFFLRREVTTQRVVLHREFDTEILGLIHKLNSLTELDEDAVEFELQATYIWRTLGNLGRYINCSEQHNELVATLHQVACAEVQSAFSHEKAQALRDALESPAQSVHSFG